MPRAKATPMHITVLAARRRREKARGRDRDRRTADTTPSEPATAVILPIVTVSLCRHCGDELPEEGSFRGFCGMGCAGDAGYLKGYD